MTTPATSMVSIGQLRGEAPSAELATTCTRGRNFGHRYLRLLSPVFMGHNRNTHISRNMRMHMCYADLHGATNRYRLEYRTVRIKGTP